MNNLAEIFEKIKKYNKIVIHRHQRPDPDAIGSQVGLGTILRDSFPHKQILLTGKQIDGFNWIGEMDEVDNDFFDDALVLVLDTANQPRVDDRRYINGSYMIKIDHHPNDDPFGDLMWVNEDASSTSEMIFDFYNQFKDQLELTSEAAKDLYAGIVGDTGRFLYPATSAHTHMVVAGLMETGFDMVAINQILDSITEPVARLTAYVYEHLTIMANGAAYITLSKETLEQFNLQDSGTAGIVSQPGRIESVKCWAIFVQQNDGTYRVRLRSKGPVINELAKQHKGGGHPLASGAVAADSNEIKEIISGLVQLADEK